MPMWAAAGSVASGLLGGSQDSGGGGMSQEQMMMMLQMLKQEKKRYKEMQGNYQPYIGAGNEALNQYMANLGFERRDAQGNIIDPYTDFTKTPGYQSGLQRGLEAVNAGAASAGSLMSGDRLRALQERGSEFQMGYFDRYMNQLAGLQGNALGAIGDLGGKGLSSINSMYGTTMGAMSNMSQLDAQQAQMEQARKDEMLGGIFGGLGVFMGGGGADMVSNWFNPSASTQNTSYSSWNDNKFQDGWNTNIMGGGW